MQITVICTFLLCLFITKVFHFWDSKIHRSISFYQAKLNNLDITNPPKNYESTQTSLKLLMHIERHYIHLCEPVYTDTHLLSSISPTRTHSKRKWAHAVPQISLITILYNTLQHLPRGYIQTFPHVVRSTFFSFHSLSSSLWL